MMCLGLEPRVAESCAQTNQLSYGAPPSVCGCTYLGNVLLNFLV